MSRRESIQKCDEYFRTSNTLTRHGGFSMAVASVSSAALQAQAAPVAAQQAQASSRPVVAEAAGDNSNDSGKSAGSSAAAVQGKAQILETQA